MRRLLLYSVALRWLRRQAAAIGFRARRLSVRNQEDIRSDVREPDRGDRIEHIVTNDFIYEFTRSDKVDVVNRESADAVFSGVVTAVSTETVSRTGSQNALENRVTVYLDLSLADRRGNVLWTVKRVSDDETYEVQSVKLSTERRKMAAIKILSRRMAETVYNLVTDIE